jgi:hypothetical protein
MIFPESLYWLLALSAVLATWRVTNMLYIEDGPWFIFRRLRTATGVRHYDDGKPMAFPEGNPFSCFLCLSQWVAFAILPLALWVWPVVMVFALSGGAIMVHAWFVKTYGAR